MATVTSTSDLGAEPTPRPARPEPRRFNIGRGLAWTFMVLVILVSLFPFYWMLRTALSSNNALYAGSGSLLPVRPSWGGFERVFFLRQFFLGISREVEEAALVEGVPPRYGC